MRLALWLLIMSGLLSSCGLHSRGVKLERQPDGTWTKGPILYTRTNWAALAALVSCTALDMATTEYGIETGHRELNPVLQKRAARIPLMLGGSVIVWALGEWSGYRNVVWIVGGLPRCAAGSWNLAEEVR